MKFDLKVLARNKECCAYFFHAKPQSRREEVEVLTLKALARNKFHFSDITPSHTNPFLKSLFTSAELFVQRIMLPYEAVIMKER